MNHDQRDGRQAMLEVLTDVLATAIDRDGNPMVDRIRGALTRQMAARLNLMDVGVNADHLAGAVAALHEIGVAFAMRAAELRASIADETTADGETEEHSPTLVSPPPAELDPIEATTVLGDMLEMSPTPGPLYHCGAPTCPGLPHRSSEVAHPCGTRESSR